MTMNTTAECEHCVRQSANRVQRAALFDGDGRLVWSSTIQPPGEVGAPRSTSRCGMSYRQLLQQWFVETAPSDSPGENGWRGLDWHVESDVDIPTRTGQLLRLVQRRTPDGGTLVLLVDESVDGRAPAGGSSDAMRLAMTEAVSWLSQELRTSLNSILGFAQLMQRDAKEPLSSRHRPRAHEIVKAGDQVVGLLGKVLDLCRAELGRVALEIAPTDPRKVVEAARASLASFAARSQVELSTRGSESADIPLVLADREWLQEILTTLGKRAIEQQRSPASVAIELSIPHNGVVRINVFDNGPGIHPDAQATLFLPMRSARGSDGLEANGLALAIAHRLAELMHCQLRFRSVSTKGTDFWIDIPTYRGPC